MGSVLNNCLHSCVPVPFDLLTWILFSFVSGGRSESKDGSKSKGRRGAKNSATAAKVALMKLKLHAAGDKGLPQVKSQLSILLF